MFLKYQGLYLEREREREREKREERREREKREERERREREREKRERERDQWSLRVFYSVMGTGITNPSFFQMTLGNYH